MLPSRPISNYPHDLLQGGAGKGCGTLKGCLVPGALSCISPQPAHPLCTQPLIPTLYCLLILTVHLFSPRTPTHTPSEMVGLVRVHAGTDGKPSSQSTVSLGPNSTVRSSSIRNRSIFSPTPPPPTTCIWSPSKVQIFDLISLPLMVSLQVTEGMTGCVHNVIEPMVVNTIPKHRKRCPGSPLSPSLSLGLPPRSLSPIVWLQPLLLGWDGGRLLSKEGAHSEMFLLLPSGLAPFFPVPLTKGVFSANLSPQRLSGSSGGIFTLWDGSLGKETEKCMYFPQG